MEASEILLLQGLWGSNLRSIMELVQNHRNIWFLLWIWHLNAQWILCLSLSRKCSQNTNKSEQGKRSVVHLISKCMFFGRNDVKAETPVLWPPHVKTWLIGKDSDAGRDWGQEEKGMTEDEMAGWHHRLNGHEFEWTLGDGDGQGGLACCNSWVHKELDTTEWLNWTEHYSHLLQ